MEIFLSKEYQNIQKDIMRYIKKYLSDNQTAEDLYQEVLVTFLNKNIQIENEVALKIWLLNTAKNHILDYYKSKNRENKINTILFQDLHIKNRVSTEKSFKKLNFENNILNLKEKIKKINDREYAIIYLWKVEKLTLKQIAEIYEISARTIMRIIKRIIPVLVIKETTHNSQN